MREYMIAWRARRKASTDYNIDEERRRWREQHQVVRRLAMDKLGGPTCCNCGCDAAGLLEINHVKGGGRKASKSQQNRQLYRAIANDKVVLSDYNVLCRVCNALHYVADVMGIRGHTVSWRGSLIG